MLSNSAFWFSDLAQKKTVGDIWGPDVWFIFPFDLPIVFFWAPFFGSKSIPAFGSSFLLPNRFLKLAFFEPQPNFIDPKRPFSKIIAIIITTIIQRNIFLQFSFWVLVFIVFFGVICFWEFHRFQFFPRFQISCDKFLVVTLHPNSIYPSP